MNLKKLVNKALSKIVYVREEKGHTNRAWLIAIAHGKFLDSSNYDLFRHVVHSQERVGVIVSVLKNFFRQIITETVEQAMQSCPLPSNLSEGDITYIVEQVVTNSPSESTYYEKHTLVEYIQTLKQQRKQLLDHVLYLHRILRDPEGESLAEMYERGKVETLKQIVADIDSETKNLPASEVIKLLALRSRLMDQLLDMAKEKESE